MKVRITGEDSSMSAILKMAGGNPGAITVLVEIIKAGPTVDPDDFMGGFGAILGLDSHGIYESEIWMLYKDVCGEDINKVLTLLRGVQLGLLSETQLKHAVRGDRGYGSADLLPITFSACLEGVREICPRFAAGIEF